MSVYFNVKDVIHRIAVKFVKANLPNASKPFNLRAVHLREVDIRGLAGKAEAYDIPVSAKVIDEGLSAGFELMKYLVADGYIIKTPLFTIRVKFPGQYNGTETGLAEGKYPIVTISFTKEFKEYLKQKVEVEIDGIKEVSGFIAEMRDEATGTVDERLTPGNVLTIRGKNLSVAYDAEHANEGGVLFVPPSGKALRADIIAVNGCKKLKVIIPQGLKHGTAYTVVINTMSGANQSGKSPNLLKEMRSIKSRIQLMA